jgi:ribosomal protein S6E (S10)
MHDSTCMPGNLSGIIRTMIGKDMNGKEMGGVIYGMQAVYGGSDDSDFVMGRDYDQETG